MLSKRTSSNLVEPGRLAPHRSSPGTKQDFHHFPIPRIPSRRSRTDFLLNNRSRANMVELDRTSLPGHRSAVAQLAVGHRFSLYEKQPTLSLFPNVHRWSFNDRFREVAKRGRGLSWPSADVEVPRSSSQPEDKRRGCVAAEGEPRACQCSCN